MAGEKWAARLVERELKRHVCVNDNGKAPGMYDLRIGPVDAPEVVIEVVGAVDSAFAETWNVGPARGPLSLALKGDWNVEISVDARGQGIKALRQNLQRILQRMESQNIRMVDVDYRLKWTDITLFNELDSLWIRHAHCYRAHGSGNVHLSTPGNGGAVDEAGSEVSNWLGQFLRDPAREDVLSKLQRSGANARHAFVIATFGGTPWPVESYLMGELIHIPSQPPDLPPPVTAAWVVSDFGQKGLYWDGNSCLVVTNIRDRSLAS